MVISRILPFLALALFVSACTSASNPVDSIVGVGGSASQSTSNASTIILLPSAVTIAPLAQVQFSATGGVAPYYYSILIGSGAIDSSSGLFAASAAVGSTAIKVVDALGNSALASINITNGAGGIAPVLTISPVTKTLALNNNFAFLVSGGVSPYTFSVASGFGSIGPSTGVFSATSVGASVVEVTDSIGATSIANVTVNAPLSVSPGGLSLPVNHSVTLSASGGVPPYSYSIVFGGGSIVGGTYTAPAISGSAIARVTDSNSNSADIFITIGGALALSPTSNILSVNNSATFTASGGVPPYTYSVVVGGAGGTINSVTGQYTAPGVAGSDTVKVTDSAASFATSTVSINAAIQISPATKTLSLNNTQNFSATGGVSPYIYSLISGVGTVGATTGIYSATSTGAATVQVTDALGNISNAALTINAALSLSSNPTTLAPSNSATLTATGGVSPFTYSVLSGGGSITGTTFTAPAFASTVLLQATDAFGNTANTSVTVTAGLAISPSTKTLAISNVTTFLSSGGVTPYTYSVVAGGTGGTINSGSGVYTAPAGSGTDTVRVTDSLGNISNAAVTINSAVAISPAIATVGLNNSYTFTASGGVPPYSYSIASGVGSVGLTSGVYNGSSSGVAVVRVTDSAGNVSNANVTVSGGLTLSPNHSTVAVLNTVTLSATGGVAPYSYSITGGGGSISGTTFTAPGAAGSVTIQVTDSSANTNQSVITVNPALSMSPSTRTITTANSYTFVASGGVSPYTYSIQSGVGSVVAGTGVYTSAGVGSGVVLVTDSLGNTATSNVTVNAALAISPTTSTLTITNSTTFSATGGLAPYVYSISSGGVGTINASSGVYTAPAGAGSASVVVTDALGNTSTATVTVNANLTLSPSTYTLAINDTKTLTGLGGIPPYSYSVQSGSGTFSAAGLFTAPAGSGTTVLKVTDSVLATATATITINVALAASPSSFSIPVNNAKTITISGGVGPYTYSTTVGSISPATGTTANFSAPASSGSGNVTVTDAVGNTQTVVITVTAALAISPTSFTVAAGAGAVTKTFTATGGVAPYTYTTTLGTIVSTTGVLTPPAATTGTGSVTVTDSFSNTSSSVLTVNAALTITATKTLSINNSFTPTVTGGVTPLTYSVTSGSGTVSGAVYTAGGASGSANLRVTDAIGNTANCTVTITAALAISPTSTIVGVSNSKTFTASGGLAPYVYSAASGTINSASGFYTAPGSAGSDTVTVTDSLSNTASATVTVNAAPAISPTTLNILTNDQFGFSTSAGVPAYTYSVFSGSGSIVAANGIFTAPATTGTSVVRSTDTLGNVSSSTVTTTTPSVVDNYQYASGYASTAYASGVDGSGNIYVVGTGQHATTSNHWIVRKSSDNGATWSVVDDFQYVASQAAYGYAFATDAAGTTLYTAGAANDGSGVPWWIVRKSTDAGATWTTVDNFQFAAGKATQATSIVVLSTGDVFVSGQALNASNTGFVVTRRFHAAAWATVDSAGATAFTTLRYATSARSAGNTVYVGFACNGGGCFSGAPGFTTNYIIRSSSDGVTWANSTTLGLGCSPGGDLKIAFDGSGNLYRTAACNTAYGTYKSTDGGVTWTLLENVSLYFGTQYQPAMFVTSSGTIYTAGSNNLAIANSTPYDSWIRKQRNDGTFAFIDNYQLSTNNAGAFDIRVDVSSHIYSVGFANDAGNIAHWIVRKF